MSLTPHQNQAKFLRRRLAHDYISRPRLLELLNAGLAKPVTLVSAPPGYGKTSLLTEWLSACPLPTAWLALDTDDNNLPLFASYLVAAIRFIFPEALPASTDLVNSPLPFQPAALATILCNELADLPGEFVLVLDDLHLIQDSRIYDLLERVIRAAPPTLHLVLSTRTDAPLPFSQLRARGELCEVRARHLRFTLQESSAFLTGTRGSEISVETLTVLQDKTEGWAAALRFASLLMHEGIRADETAARLGSRTELGVTDYLFGEVLTQQPPEMQEFLFKTALIGEFTSGLCQAVLDAADPAVTEATLRELARSETIIVLDGKEPWYRYHHLFEEFIRESARARYDAATLAELHQRAFRWCREHGYVTEAIRHAVAAGDLEGGARLVGASLPALLNAEQAGPRIEAWLALFPAEFAARQLDLVISKLWLITLQFRLGAGPTMIDQAERALAAAGERSEDERRSARAVIDWIKLAYAFWTNDAATAVAMGAQTLEAFPSEFEYARGNVLAHHGMALQQIGQTDAALELMASALRSESFAEQFYRRVLIGYAEIHQSRGDFASLAETAENLLQLSRGRASVSEVWAHYFLGRAHLEWNKLVTAAQHFSAAYELRYRGNARASHESLGLLAITRQLQGQEAAAAETLQELVRYSNELRIGELAYDSGVARARLALLRGDLEDALRWAQTVQLNPNPNMLFDIEANLAQVRTLLATRAPENVRHALDETRQLVALATRLHNPWRLVELYALQAAAQSELGESSAALTSLETAVRLGELGGMIQSFHQAGPGIARLLNRLAGRGIAPRYIAKILGAGLARPAQKTTAPAAENEPRVIEPLTVRELQVLEQLAYRRTDKEIAQALVISPLTVKAHTDHIYQKLGVNNRQEAVRVGLAYGILDDRPIDLRFSKV